MTCTTHHHACECREAAFQRLAQLVEIFLEDPEGHRYQGDCPDPINPNARDPKCAVCGFMTDVHALLASLKP